MNVSIPLRSDFNGFRYCFYGVLNYVSIPLRSDFNFGSNPRGDGLVLEFQSL